MQNEIVRKTYMMTTVVTAHRHDVRKKEYGQNSVRTMRSLEHLQIIMISFSI